MRGCEVCGVSAKNSCGGCGNVSYCGVEHQKQDWTKHKSTCAPFKISSSPELGDFIVSARQLKAGDLVLHEEVSVIGPPSGETSLAPVCLVCYFPAPSYTCTECSTPLCGPSCQRDTFHSKDCAAIRKYNIGKLLQTDLSSYGLITPLRLILLRESDPMKYIKCIGLSSNLDQRSKQPEFTQYIQKSRQYSAWLQGSISEEELLKLLCILDTNTFQVLSPQSGVNLSGLYLRVSKLNHSCLPNARLIFCSDFSLKVIASTPIAKGTPVYISYTPPFYNTFTRQMILEKGKQFRCSCTRCQDPTELQTMLSGLRCGECKEGWILRSAGGTEYCCGSCSSTKDPQKMGSMERTLLAIQTNLNKECVEQLEEILYKYSDILHPNHALLTEARQHLAAALGRVEGFRYDQLNVDRLNTKVNISMHLLEVLDTLEPGLSKSRGITLLDLTEAKSRLAVKMCSSNEELLAEFLDIEKMLEESNTILSYEDDEAIEGNVAKIARQQLYSLRQSISCLRQRKKEAS